MTPATIITPIYTHNGEHDLAKGTRVQAEYFCTAYNKMYNCTEKVFSVYVKGEFWGGCTHVR